MCAAAVHEASASTTAFWQNLRAANVETKSIAIQVEADAEEVVEVATLELANDTVFLGLTDWGIKSILVPESYRHFWAEVKPLVAARFSSDEPRELLETKAVRFLYTGTPGIGKSLQGLYFMYQLRLEYGDRIDIVYQHERSELQYLFCGSGDVYYSKTVHGSFDEYLSKVTTVYMVDGKGVAERSGPSTFVFCSPDSQHWKEFAKVRDFEIRYLPVWPLQHLLVARELFYSSVSEERVAELYGKWGGVPRVALEKANDISYQVNVMDGAFSQAGCSLSDILATVGELSAPNQHSNKLLHYVVEDDYIHKHVVFASQWVAEEIVKRAGDQAERSVREFMASQAVNPQAAGLRGQVFEALAHRVLLRGGNFDIRPLLSSQASERGSEAWPPMTYKELKDTNSIGKMMDGGPHSLYLVPKAKNNAAFDAIRPPTDALQMTVSRHHPISHAGRPRWCV
jgi:hypothetical protein